MITIRKEIPEDAAAVRYIHEQAFGQTNEADLVEALRNSSAFIFSLVAVKDNQVVGHIVFNSVVIESANSIYKAVGLAPMAVLPSHQRMGIGSQLVQTGLQECEKRGHVVVVVLGYPKFYSLFGFLPAKSYGIKCEFDVPEEVFMIKELRKGALGGRSGIVKYSPEFRAAL